jgi:hypothetical protein
MEIKRVQITRDKITTRDKIKMTMVIKTMTMPTIIRKREEMMAIMKMMMVETKMVKREVKRTRVKGMELKVVVVNKNTLKLKRLYYHKMFG